MRDVLRKEVGRSLKAMPEIDRLRVAWTIACGKSMASRGQIVAFDKGVVTVVAGDPVWLDQMLSMRRTLERELARIAEVKLAGIHFTLSQNAGSERE